jgi:hypothetical protein
MILTREIEFQAIEYPIPDGPRARLIELGKAACMARENVCANKAQTEEGMKLASFEASFRENFGVVHRRPLIGRGFDL